MILIYNYTTVLKLLTINFVQHAVIVTARSIVYTIINFIVTMRSIGSLTFYVTMRSTVSTIINIIVTMRLIGSDLLPLLSL